MTDVYQNVPLLHVMDERDGFVQLNVYTFH